MEHGRLSAHNPYVGFFKHAPKSNEPFADRVLEGQFESPSERITLRKLKHSPWAGTFHLAAGVYKSTHNRFKHSKNDESELRARLNELPDFSILASLVHDQHGNHYNGRGHMHSHLAHHSHAAAAAGHGHGHGPWMAGTAARYGMGTGHVVIGRPAEDAPGPSAGVSGAPLLLGPSASGSGAPSESHASLSSLVAPAAGPGAGGSGAGTAAHMSSPPSVHGGNRGRLSSVHSSSSSSAPSRGATAHAGSATVTVTATATGPAVAHTPGSRSRSFAGEGELGAAGTKGGGIDNGTETSGSVGSRSRASSAAPQSDRRFHGASPGGLASSRTPTYGSPASIRGAAPPVSSVYQPVAIGRGAAPEGAPLPLLVPATVRPTTTTGRGTTTTSSSGGATSTAIGTGAGVQGGRQLQQVEEEGEEDIWQLRPFVEGAWSATRAAGMVHNKQTTGTVTGAGAVTSPPHGAHRAAGSLLPPASSLSPHPATSSVVTIGRSARPQTLLSAQYQQGLTLPSLAVHQHQNQVAASSAPVSVRKGSASESNASSNGVHTVQQGEGEGGQGVGAAAGVGSQGGSSAVSSALSRLAGPIPSIASSIGSLAHAVGAGDAAPSSSRQGTPLLGAATGTGTGRGRGDSGMSLHELVEDEGMPLFAAMHMLASQGSHASSLATVTVTSALPDVTGDSARSGTPSGLQPISIPADEYSQEARGAESASNIGQDDGEAGSGSGGGGLLSPLSAAVAEQWRTLWLARLQAEREGFAGIGPEEEAGGDMPSVPVKLASSVPGSPAVTGQAGPTSSMGGIPAGAQGDSEAPYEYVSPHEQAATPSMPAAFMLAHIGSSALLSSLGSAGAAAEGIGGAGPGLQAGLMPSASMVSFRPDQWEAPGSPISHPASGSGEELGGVAAGPSTGAASEPTFTIGSPGLGSGTPMAVGFSAPPTGQVFAADPAASPSPYLLPLSCGVRREDVKQDYDLGDKPIGAGGYAEVRKARRKGAVTGETCDVVIKCIKKRYLCTEEERHSAHREVDIQNAVTAAAGGAPPHIVPLMGCYEDGEARNKGFIYLVLEASPGGDLRSYVRSSSVQRFSEFQARIIAEQLLQALDYLHSTLGIVHLDVKPDNVLVHGKVQLADTEQVVGPGVGAGGGGGIGGHGGGGQGSTSSTSTSSEGGSKAGTSTEGKPLKTLIDSVRLCDFGNARRSRDPRYYRVTGNVGLVPFTQVTGTFGYVAPEILARHHYGSAADMFSLGVLLYELLAGYAPWYPASECLTTPLAFPDQPWASVSKEAKDLVAALLAMDPKRRITAHAARAHAWLAMSK